MENEIPFIKNFTRDIAKDNFGVKFFISLLYCLTVSFGLAGNILVVLVVARTKSIQTVTNLFIANLALSDILMCLVAAPFTPLSLFMKSWILPEAVCKLLPITMGVSVYVSTLTSMAIALDRFFMIVHPFLPRMRISLCFLIILIIWLIALLISMPLAVYHQKDFDKDNQVWVCRENWPKTSSREVFTIISFVLQFVVPCSIISVCYFRISLILRNRLRKKIGCRSINRIKDVDEIKRKRRTNTILTAMVAIFVVCWIPLNALLIATDVLSQTRTTLFVHSPYFNLIFLICHLFAMSSAVYNPFLYAWINENFKKEVYLILPCLPFNTRHEVRTRVSSTMANRYSCLIDTEGQTVQIPLRKVINSSETGEQTSQSNPVPNPSVSNHLNSTNLHPTLTDELSTDVQTTPNKTRGIEVNVPTEIPIDG